MKKKMVVLSEDALADVDMGYLSALPNFERYIRGGATVKNFRSVFPTITYIDHTSMITGCYPDKHGVLSTRRYGRAVELVCVCYKVRGRFYGGETCGVFYCFCVLACYGQS